MFDRYMGMVAAMVNIPMFRHCHILPFVRDERLRIGDPSKAPYVAKKRSITIDKERREKGRGRRRRGVPHNCPPRPPATPSKWYFTRENRDNAATRGTMGGGGRRGRGRVDVM